MSWITIILVMMAFSIMHIIGKLYYEKYTNVRMYFEILSIIGFVIFGFVSVVYSVENSKTIKVIEITPSFYAKSDSKLYLEFDTLGYKSSRTYTDAKTFNSTTDSTTFYLCEYVNLWNNNFYELHEKDYYIGFEDKDLNKIIKNRW